MISASPSCRDAIEKHSPDFVVYRDKENRDYAVDAQNFLNICKEFKGVKCYLHQDLDLAYSLGAEGVHLTSKQFDKIEDAKNKNLEVIISTHTLDEVLDAQRLGADAVTYSPIFFTPNKGEPKGVDELESVVESVDIKVFALGGITTQDEVNMVEKSGAYGFASIRFFS
jgi:thiamine-phosphate pyrophosphorylase